jgi:tetratricopeptide (TPR) repeat protein
VAAAIGSRALIDLNQGRFAEGQALQEDALARMKAALGGNHPRVQSLAFNVAVGRELLGDYDGAQEQFERALAARREAYGPGHPKVAVVLLSLGVLEHRRHRYDLAQARAEEARVIFEQALGPAHPRVADALSNIGDALLAQDDVDAAEDAFGQSLTIFRAPANAGNHGAFFPLRGLARVALRRGAPGGALALTDEALAAMPEGDPTELAEARFLHGVALWDAGGDRDIARAEVEAARADLEGSTRSRDDLRREIDDWLAGVSAGRDVRER